MEYWNDVEVDLLTQYHILDPLALTWRKLLVLVSGLNADSRFVTIMREESPEYRKEMMQRALNPDEPLRPSIKANRVTSEEFLKGI